ARCGKRNSSSVLEALSFGAFNKAFKPTRTEKDWLSSDPQVVDRYLADPLCGGPLSTQSWYDFLRGLAELSSPTAMAKISCELPIYVFSGALDPVGQNGKGITDLVNVLHRAGVREVQSKLYAGGRHEMLNEVNYQEVYEDVWQWLAGLSIAQAEVLDLTGIGGAESG
ncbi:MAG: lysophospholipase, partial [Porticoccaceae bacterium]|nr:lysophospholipase [Porticoccaceae bacterium]